MQQHMFHWYVLLQKCQKTVCKGTSRQHAGRKAEAFPYVQVLPGKPVRGKSGVRARRGTVDGQTELRR